MLLADNSVMSVMRMPGAPFALVMNSQRNAHKRRLTAFLNAIADENVEVHIHLVKHDAALPAAAHAEAGQFEEAVRFEKQALESERFTKQFGDAAKKRLKDYEDKKPHRE